MKYLAFFSLLLIGIVSCQTSQMQDNERIVNQLIKTVDSLQEEYISKIPYDSVALETTLFKATLDSIRTYSIFPEDKQQRFWVSQFSNYNEFMEKALLKNNHLKLALDYSKHQLQNLLLDISEKNLPTDSLSKYIAIEKTALEQTQKEFTDFKEEYLETKQHIGQLRPKIKPIIDSICQNQSPIETP